MIEGALKADGRLAAKNAVKIRAALHQVVDFKRVFNKYQETMPQPTDNPTQDRVRARSWLILNVYLNDEPLRQTVMRAWAEAYVLGQAAADEWIAKTERANKADDIEINWDNWKPGDKATALLLNPTKGFEAYLQSTGGASYFKNFNKETVINLGTALSDSIAAGLDAESAAVMIGRHVASSSRALTIAITEQNRAMSFSTIERYKEAGLAKMEWAVSDPCDICAKNDGQVIVIGQTFASGDAQPPAHPHCRCVLLPVIPGMEDEPEMPGATLVVPPSPVDFGPDATTFRTPKEEIEQVVAALQEGRSLDEGLDIYQALDARPFVPGQWELLPRIAVRAAAIENVSRSFVFPMTRQQVERGFFSSNTIKKVDRAFIEKAVIYKSGSVEVQFSSTGLSLTEAERKMVLKKVEELQIANPKPRAVVHIDKNASGKYGWAYGGKSDLWVAPRTIKDPKRNDGAFKMPATPATTQFEYTIAHEWGHLIDDITDGAQNPMRANLIARLKTEYPNAFKSGYSAENTKEFFAEMFTEYYNTGGQTPNPLVQAMAKEFGWQTPEVIGLKLARKAKV
jgi:SPP1 gp7 family putative phage head morphogenesis protein